jgi:hypothetical protein
VIKTAKITTIFHQDKHWDHQQEPQETAASTLMKYIINKNVTTPTSLTPKDPVDAFLAGTAPTLETLSPYYLNLAKSKIVATVQEYELAMLMQEGQGPT